MYNSISMDMVEGPVSKVRLFVSSSSYSSKQFQVEKIEDQMELFLEYARNFGVPQVLTLTKYLSFNKVSLILGVSLWSLWRLDTVERYSESNKVSCPYGKNGKNKKDLIVLFLNFSTEEINSRTVTFPLKSFQLFRDLMHLILNLVNINSHWSSALMQQLEFVCSYP